MRGRSVVSLGKFEGTALIRGIFPRSQSQTKNLGRAGSGTMRHSWSPPLQCRAGDRESRDRRPPRRAAVRQGPGSLRLRVRDGARGRIMLNGTGSEIHAAHRACDDARREAVSQLVLLGVSLRHQRQDQVPHRALEHLVHVPDPLEQLRCRTRPPRRKR